MIVWADVETTGLNENKGHLLEVALVTTDDNLVEGQAINVVINPNYDAIPIEDLKMDDVVREMHTKNGLLSVIATAGMNLQEAEKFALRMVQRALYLSWHASACREHNWFRSPMASRVHAEARSNVQLQVNRREQHHRTRETLGALYLQQ